MVRPGRAETLNCFIFNNGHRASLPRFAVTLTPFKPSRANFVLLDQHDDRRMNHPRTMLGEKAKHRTIVGSPTANRIVTGEFFKPFASLGGH